MASEKDHVKLANRNHDFLMQLLADGAVMDWAITVAFYKAVHIVEAVFANDLHIHSTSHTEREKTLKIARYRAIFKDFGHLYTASRVARYLEASGAGKFKTFSNYMSDAKVIEVIRKRLYGVEQNALSFLTTESLAAIKKLNPTEF